VSDAVPELAEVGLAEVGPAEVELAEVGPTEVGPAVDGDDGGDTRALLAVGGTTAEDIGDRIGGCAGRWGRRGLQIFSRSDSGSSPKVAGVTPSSCPSASTGSGSGGVIDTVADCHSVMSGCGRCSPR